ncbi:caspase family protein [Phytohabitans kaempferiae]|uniref:Caspase family protein n=1 Tax=Phytohabitans kaempferiae TaxID=1620943 RepID=A0ABV6LYU7_9ACTN
MTYRALLIGNSTFDADASLNPLNAPTKDVARLHRALVDSETGLFADENVRLVTERTTDELLDELDAFFSSAHREDLLLLYYSGHGLLDERNRLFLCGRNTRSDRLLRTAVSNVRINEFIGQSVAKCTVIVLDCCSSGMFKGGGVGLQLAGPGRYIVSSTRGSALANDAATATGTSLFTEYLVTGLLGEAADRNGDGYVDLREIYDYVHGQLTASTHQVPHCRFDGDAAVSLARRRVPPPEPPPISKVPRTGQRREPVFALSETSITLRDVDPEERLAPEVVEIYQLGDEPVDCTAETEASWLSTEIRGDRVVIRLNPREGPNRGKIMIRDRASGTAQALRVEVHVKRRSRPTPQPTEPMTKGLAPSSSAPPPPPPPVVPPSQVVPPSPVVPPPVVVPPAEAAAPSDAPPAEAAPPRPQARPKVVPPITFEPPPHIRAQPPAQRQGTAPAQPPQWTAQPVAPQRPAPQVTWPSPPEPQPAPLREPEPDPPREPEPEPTNRKAVAALVVAILAFLLVLSAVGVLLVPVALVLARKASAHDERSGQPAGRGLIKAARIISWLAVGAFALAVTIGLIASAS